MPDTFIEHGYLLLIFIIGVITGFIDATVAMGGFFAIPALILSGLPPHTAIAVDKFGVIGSALGSFVKHFKNGTILWKWVPVFALISLIGGAIGAQISVSIPAEMLRYILGGFILAVLPLLALKKQLGVIDTRHTKTILMICLGLILFLLARIYSGFAAAGSGITAILVLCGVMGFTLLQYQGTIALTSVILSLSSVYVFWMADKMDWFAGFALIIGMYIGAHFGATKAIAIGNQKLKKYVIAACVFGAIALFLK